MDAVLVVLLSQVLNAVPELVTWCHSEAEWKAKAVVAPAYVDLVNAMWKASPQVCIYCAEAYSYVARYVWYVDIPDNATCKASPQVCVVGCCSSGCGAQITGTEIGLKSMCKASPQVWGALVEASH
jgi:hypothetical protein